MISRNELLLISHCFSLLTQEITWTSIFDRYGRQMDVETTFCAYWVVYFSSISWCESYSVITSFCSQLMLVCISCLCVVGFIGTIEFAPCWRLFRICGQLISNLCKDGSILQNVVWVCIASTLEFVFAFDIFENWPVFRRWLKNVSFFLL